MPMKLNSIGDVIATRELFVANDDSVTIVVKMGKPQPFPEGEGEGYFCPVLISGYGVDELTYAGGVDAFQSIEFALTLIGTALKGFNASLDDQLRWEGDDDEGFGFPVLDDDDDDDEEEEER